MSTITSVLDGCKPRTEVLKGTLTDAMFGADFGAVVQGTSRAKIYSDGRTFFENTFPTSTLKKITHHVFSTLAKPESGLALRLSTGFGGGKSHALMVLWHLGKNIADRNMGIELLPVSGRPKKITVAAIDAEKLGAEKTTHKDVLTHSFWGELAYQIGGKSVYDLVAAEDHPHSVPDNQVISEMLGTDPVLVLIDEIVVYMKALDDRGRNSLQVFIRKLLTEITNRKQAVLVITDPAAQLAYDEEAKAIESQIRRLDEDLSRKVSDYEPIGREAAQIISRRLFEDIDRSKAGAVADVYQEIYQRIVSETDEAVPKEVLDKEYKKAIKDNFPFHPRLMETAQNRLGPLPNYQRSRGALRLFARIVRDVWSRKLDVPIISAADMNWNDADIQGELLSRLDRQEFSGAADEDIGHHARDLDKEYNTDMHTRVASALLLESLPLTDTSYLRREEVTQICIGPENAGHEPGEALDRLLGICWYTYPALAKDAFQFKTEANVNKLIEEGIASNMVPETEAVQNIHAIVEGYFRGASFSLKRWPETPADVRDEQKALSLSLCDSVEKARDIVNLSRKENGETQPRAYRNAIIAVAPEPGLLKQAVDNARRYLIASRIRKERKDPQIKKQINGILPKLERIHKISAVRGFNQIFLYNSEPRSLDEKYLVAKDETLFRGTGGQGKIMDYLNEKGLALKSTGALDPLVVVEKLVPAATPSTQYKGAVSCADVLDQAYRSSSLKLIVDTEPIRKGTEKAVLQGSLLLRTSDGRVYDDKGCIIGDEGQRQRREDLLTSFPLDEQTFVASSSASCASDWLHVDDVKKGDVVSEPPPPPAPLDFPVDIDNWEQAQKTAQERELLEGILKTNDVEAMSRLPSVAQPLSARTVRLTINMSGDLKDGGFLNFSLERIKPEHALKPLQKAAGFARNLRPEYDFEAKLELDFRSNDGQKGRSNMEGPLQQAHGQADDLIEVEFRFAPTK
ncbi:MAG: DUF499 domain-containing protein [Candidatus Neomarinimicrobiota bacterium]